MGVFLYIKTLVAFQQTKAEYLNCIGISKKSQYFLYYSIFILLYIV